MIGVVLITFSYALEDIAGYGGYGSWAKGVVP